ncbi:MAG: hypothetical protein ACE5JD_18040 [Candidatus Methylomirabilia bacterium]
MMRANGQTRQGPTFLLLALARDGRVVREDMLENIELRLRSATDCFLFCPGWLERKAETKALARRFFAMLEGWLARVGDRVAPLGIALHWPSKPFADPELAPSVLDGGLWPELERRISGPMAAEPGRLVALLLELAQAQVAQAPEEEAELDQLIHRLHDARTRGGSLLAPFQALSLWVMKQRAGQVGQRFGREQWAPLWEALPRPRPRLHLIGHSFGARLLTSAVLGGVRPSSLILLQAPFSAFAFAPDVPGYDCPGLYHRVLAERRVSGPIVAVRSIRHAALRILYPFVTESGAVDRGGPGLRTKETVGRSAIGSVGIRGLDAPEIELTLCRQIGLPQWPVVNVDGSALIRARHTLLGAHRDIFHREVAALVLLAGGLLHGHPDGIRPRPLSPLAA